MNYKLAAVLHGCRLHASHGTLTHAGYQRYPLYFYVHTMWRLTCAGLDWIGLSSVLRPCQHSLGYMGDGFYRSKDPTNSIKVLNEQIVHRQIKHTINKHEHKTQQVPLLQ